MATMGNSKEVIEQLNSFLRGEISAVETYRQAIEKLTDNKAKMQLQQCHQSHQQNVSALKARIQQIGGKPAEGSGPWGAFAKVVQAGADVFGEKTAIAALEEGEDHGLRDYKSGIEKLDSETRRFIEAEILAKDKQTHEVMRGLKKTFA
ncbi:MAG: hypothetical protein NVS3B20_21930 [Polyangiales bacterium]